MPVKISDTQLHFVDIVARDLSKMGDDQLDLLIKHAESQVEPCWGSDPAWQETYRRVANLAKSERNARTEERARQAARR